MRKSTTLGISRHVAEKIRKLAEHHGEAAAALVERLVDREFRACGLDGPPMPELKITYQEEDGDTILILDFDAPEGVYSRFEATTGEATGIAHTIRKVASDGGAHINADCGWLSISRRGAGVIFERVAGDLPRFRLGVTPARALAIAKEIEDAAAEARTNP